MKSQLNWALLSTARINRRLIPALRAAKRSKLAAVASREEARAREYAAEWQIPRAIGSYEALLADPEIDVVYIPLPNALHAEWAVKAAEAGKHVLCEKPLALSLAEVDRIRAAAEQSGVRVMEAFMYRHHPINLEAQRIARSGALGKIVYLRGSFSFLLDRPDDVRWDYGLGGGALWDVGCYPVSYCRSLLGQEPVEVYGQQVTTERGVDLTFTGELRFADDILAQFDCSFVTPYRVGMEIVGEKAAMYIKLPFNNTGKNDAIRIVEEGRERRVNVRARELYVYQVENFEAAILDGEPQRITLEDSRENIAALSGLYESARVGKPVKMADWRKHGGQ